MQKACQASPLFHAECTAGFFSQTFYLCKLYNSISELRWGGGGQGKVIERDDARVRQCLRHFQRVLKCTGFCGAFVTVGGVSLTFYSAKDPLSAFSSVRLCVTLFSGYWNSCMDSVLKWLCVI